jgi:uncharacterized membrane protein
MPARAIGLVAALQAVLRIAPLLIQALGGRGLPTPGSLNDPTRALTVLRASPDVPVVAGLIFATGVTQVVVVVALADRIRDRAPQSARLSTIFGVIAAAFLLIDGALGMTALPQLAQVAAHQDMAGGAYLAILGIRNGIDRVIPLTLGIWALAAHGPAWRHRLLPRPVTVLGLLLGVLGIAGAVFPTAGLASLVVNLVWTTAFAAVMLRTRARRPNRHVET